MKDGVVLVSCTSSWIMLKRVNSDFLFSSHPKFTTVHLDLKEEFIYIVGRFFSSLQPITHPVLSKILGPSTLWFSCFFMVSILVNWSLLKTMIWGGGVGFILRNFSEFLWYPPYSFNHLLLSSPETFFRCRSIFTGSSVRIHSENLQAYCKPWYSCSGNIL